MPYVPAAKVHEPRKKGSTTKARGATFNSLTRLRGTTFISALSRGPLGDLWETKFNAFDTQCQGWIALALKEPGIAAQVRKSHASGAELAIAGRFLSHGFKEGDTLLFQSEKFTIDSTARSEISKRFVVDDAVQSRGLVYYINVDGVFYHSRTEIQEFKDAVRDGKIRPKGTVLDIADTDCFAAATLDGYFARWGL